MQTITLVIDLNDEITTKLPRVIDECADIMASVHATLLDISYRLRLRAVDKTDGELWTLKQLDVMLGRKLEHVQLVRVIGWIERVDYWWGSSSETRKSMGMM